MSLPTLIDAWEARRLGITVYEAQRIRQRLEAQQRLDAKRNKAIELLGGKCVSCDTTFNLEFHHFRNPRNGDRRRKISYLLKNSWEKVLRELEDCELLCTDCHILEHKD